MTKLLATKAFQLLLVNIIIKGFFEIIFINFLLVLEDSTSNSIFRLLPTTPPYLTTPFTLMRPATPVVVINFMIFLSAEATYFYPQVYIPTLLKLSFKLFESLSEYVILVFYFCILFERLLIQVSSMIEITLQIFNYFISICHY